MNGEIKELRDDDYLLLDKEGRRTISGRALKALATGGLPIVVLTQAEFDALTSKDPNTIYFVRD